MHEPIPIPEDNYGTETERSIPNAKPHKSVNYRDEVVTAFYNVMLEAIIDEYLPIDKEASLKSVPSICDPKKCDAVCSKSFKDLSNQDLLMSVMDIQGSVVSLGQKELSFNLANSGTEIVRASVKSKRSTKIHKSTLTSIRTLKDRSTSRVSNRRKSSKRSRKSDVSHKKSETSSKFGTSITATDDIDDDAESWMVSPRNEYVLIRFKNGNVYEGYTNKRYLHGKGTFIWADGTKYVGDFNFGEPTGQAQITYSDLSWYAGEVVQGFRHGYGSMYISGGPQIYSGFWFGGKKHGNGWMLYGENNWYEGEWDSSLRHNKGLRVYANGSRYCGEWKDGKQHGFGYMVWNNGDFYKGEWENGKRHGYGEYVWNTFFNTTLTFPVENIYKGTWTNGEMHGVGVMNFGMEGGARLAGLWQNNKKHGAGVVVCENGTIIESNPLFLNDKPVHLTDSGQLDLGDPAHCSTPARPLSKGAGGDADTANVLYEGNSMMRDSLDGSSEIEIEQEMLSDVEHENTPEQSHISTKSSSSSSSFIDKTTMQLRERSSLFLIMEQIRTEERTDDLSKQIKDRIDLNKGKFPDVKYHYKSLAIPLQIASEHIDASIYVDLAMDKLNRSLADHTVINSSYLDFFLKSSIEKDRHSLKRTSTIEKPSTFKELTNESYSKSKNTTLNMTIEEMPTYEEKCLRNTIIFYLPRLRDLYDDYANVAHLGRVNFRTCLVRMFLWQLYRDCELPQKGYSLIKTDNILSKVKNITTETEHNPFEKIYFSQFLHSLISIAWDMYGEAVTVDGNESILRTVLTKFLEEVIFPKARQYKGRAFFEYQDLFPLQCVYGLYRSLGEPHTVLDFLRNSCIIRNTEPPEIYRSSPYLERPVIFCGKNITSIDHNIGYLLEKQPTIHMEQPKKPISYEDDPFRQTLYILRSLGPKTVLNCVREVIPCIEEKELIVDIEYPLTFLEFYEILLNCVDVLKKVFAKQRRREGVRFARETIEIIFDVIFGPESKNESTISGIHKKRSTRKSSTNSRSSKKTSQLTTGSVKSLKVKSRSFH